MVDHLKVNLTEEDRYFTQQSQDQIENLRGKIIQDSDQSYREDHLYHCFRCGTKSLVEIQKGEVSVDICINEKCGALHLDPGELDALFEDRELIKKVRKSILNIFK